MKIYTVNGTFPGIPLDDKDSHAKLYHYTSLDTFKLIWESQKLKFGLISEVNDINEYNKRISTPLLNGSMNDIKQRIYIASQIICSYKQISLTKDYDSYKKGCMSPMMWGHYGDKRKGVCIELDFDKIHFESSMYYNDVTYSDVIKHSIEIPIECFNESLISLHLLADFGNIFFTKTSDWIGENEFRIISNKHEYLDVKDAIANVYVTECDSNTCIEVERIVGNEVAVKFVHYIGGGDDCRLPVLTNAKEVRYQMIKAQNDPKNILNSL